MKWWKGLSLGKKVGLGAVILVFLAVAGGNGESTTNLQPTTGETLNQATTADTSEQPVEAPVPKVESQSTETASQEPEPQPEPVREPIPEPKPVSKPKKSTSNCDPNYSPCVPKVSYDLDCSDISFSVTVIGTDTHRFDGDGDGAGCESN